MREVGSENDDRKYTGYPIQVTGSTYDTSIVIEYERNRVPEDKFSEYNTYKY